MVLAGSLISIYITASFFLAINFGYNTTFQQVTFIHFCAVLVTLTYFDIVRDDQCSWGLPGAWIWRRCP